MKINTFYEIYYSHRVKKAKIFTKLYIILTLPINYLINKALYPKKTDLDILEIKNPSFYNKSLASLLKYFNSDKGEYFKNQYQKPINLDDKYLKGHKYHSFYEKFLINKKKNKINILELGSFKGNATAAFFFYFKKGNFFSGDLYPDLFCYKSKRIKNFFIDTSCEKELKKKIIQNKENYDLIIEDAGHYLKDQIISLFILFRKLNKNGVFVIEELDFPNTRKDMNLNNEKPSLKEILGLIKKRKNFSSKYITKKDKKYFLSNFKSINIFRGEFNEIAFIKKK